jgi:hypothetical protein
VLDHGSGEAIHADLVAARSREVLLCDAAVSVRASVAARFAGNPKIKAIAPEDVDRSAECRLDLVFANSLVQYLTAPSSTEYSRSGAACLRPAACSSSPT